MNLGKIGIIGLGYLSSFLYKKLNKKFQLEIFSSFKTKKLNNVKEIYKDSREFNPYLSSLDTLIICSSFFLGGNVSRKIFKKYESYVENIIKFTSPENLIYISSSSVYGFTSKNSAFKENSILNGTSDYALEKINCEKMLLRLHKQNFFANCLILRPSNIYGINTNFAPKRGLLNKLKKNIDDSFKFKIWGNMENLNDFIHISDFSSALNNILLEGFSKINIYNVGSGNAIKLGEIYDFHQKHFSTENLEIFFDNSKVENNFLDISKLENHINFSPNIHWTSYPSK